MAEVVAQLRAYKEALDEGLLTQEEFDAKKKVLLRDGQPPAQPATG